MVLVLTSIVLFLNLLSFQQFRTDSFPLIPFISGEHKRDRRYAFQMTHKCLSFTKVFLCITECLQRDFQIAHSDRHCQCRCFDKRDKYKYNPFPVPTDVPATIIPDWLIQKLIREGKWVTKSHHKGSEADGDSDESEGSGSNEGSGSGDGDARNITGTGATPEDGGTGTTGSQPVDGDTTGAESPAQDR